jgi:hypothetical protein
MALMSHACMGAEKAREKAKALQPHRVSLRSSNVIATAAPVMASAADIFWTSPTALITYGRDVCAYLCAVYTDEQHVH